MMYTGSSMPIVHVFVLIGVARNFFQLGGGASHEKNYSKKFPRILPWLYFDVFCKAK